MSREIKFRAWDTDNEIFVNCSNHTISQISNHYSGLGNRFVYQQYTGLKDKNGKDIYEGDIIYIPLYGNAIIIWNDDVCSFQYAYHAIGKGTSIGGRMTNTMYKHESIIKYEIIGNIYQNPEFIK